jgi:hypothetical protein
MPKAAMSAVVQDVTPAEAVAGDPELESEIGLGATVGDAGSPPESMARRPPHVEAESAESRVTRLRERYPIRPGAPIPAGLRTHEERRALNTRRDETPPPQHQAFAPPPPMPPPSPAAGLRDFDSLLKATIKAAVDEELDEERDLLVALQGDRKKRRAAAEPAPAPGQERRRG